LHIRSLGEAAKLTVKEDPSTKFAPYMPFPADRVRRTNDIFDEGHPDSSAA
jgi:hypothetical protein